MRLRLIAVLISCLVVGGSTASAAVAGAAETPHPPKAHTLGIEGGWRSYFREGVVLLGLVDTYGTPTSYRFEWGRTRAYGRCAYVPEGSYAYSLVGPVEVEGLTSRLQRNTTYHYRLVVWNEAGRSVGRDRTFHTPSG